MHALTGNYVLMTVSQLVSLYTCPLFNAAPGNNGITFNISSTCSSLTLHWTAPSDIGNLDITSYQVKIADEEIPVPLDPNVRMHTFTGLHPNRMYSYQVKAMNLIGYGPYTATQSTTTSPRG